MAPGCSEDYPQGLFEVDGVPVVDVISTGVRLCEVLGSMRQAGIPWISRVATYSSPPANLLAAVETIFPYHGAGSHKLS
ncbi:MAG: hypothetical protein JRJ56_04410 [Deltaproteobacteria bacterium]|nr:hypothetical protein [Deltaproteobacteria bacterium]